ncbi:hypothetical protein [Chromobacterium subtsugae]|uniref:hypothetical protein n=1 Tax=Chromobacterium subtsugae TaxID=251747 RepID=UPI000AEC2286|nr:hypothetical protein [Chromobacterium subtsugae]
MKIDEYPFRADISVYDHVLNEEECDALPFMCFDHANDNNCLDDYYVGEKKFCGWFGDLIGISNEVVFFAGRKIGKNELRRLIILGLRERKLSELEFSDGRLVVRFGYDQTHNVFSMDGDLFDRTIKLAKLNGLHLIS